MPIPGLYQRVAEGQKSQRKIGTVEDPKKFKGQDFNSLRDLCLSRKQLFEDDTFPANLYSIGQDLLSQDKLLSIKWKRPTELQTDARFLVDGASRFDIMQGEIGDCWVLAVVGALTMHRKFLENVVPNDQEFTYKYAGIFHFRFWQFGEWVDVVIDDRLPMLNGRFLSVQPRVSNEFWPSLLEKAYAKLRGSYQNLHWGFISEAFVDFTGGVQMNFNLSSPPPDLKDIVLAAARSQSLMGCTTPGELHTGNIELHNGLVQGHAYTVTNCAQVIHKDQWYSTIRGVVTAIHYVREGEERRSEDEKEKRRSEDEKEKRRSEDEKEKRTALKLKKKMRLFLPENYCNHTGLYLSFFRCHDVLYTVRAPSARGSNTAPNICAPPPYVTVEISEEEIVGRGPSALLGSASGKQLIFPGKFCLLVRSGVKNGSPQKYSQQQATEIINSGLEAAREVTRPFMAPPGNYVILPFTQNKGQESEFLLRIFMKTSQIAEYTDEATSSESSRDMYSNNASSQSENSRRPQRNRNQAPTPNDASLSDFDSRLSINRQNPQTVIKRYQDGNYENIFARYANQNSEMYAEHLQMLLNDVVITDQTLVAGRGEFSLDSCRAILMLMDLNANGRLNIGEFGRLWKRLNMCKDLFRSIDTNQSGYLDGFGLAKAVQESGLVVSDAVVNIMLLRYANYAQRMNFADFVSCMIRLETVTKVFQNLTKDGVGVYLSAEEWMQIIMSS
ncbi:Belongs to the peptidase C2 family [Pristimantis euphronides]